MKLRAPSINQGKKPQYYEKSGRKKSKSAAESKRHSKRCAISTVFHLRWEKS